MIKYICTPPPIKQDIPFVLTENQQWIFMPLGDVHAWSEAWPQEKFIRHLEWGMERGAYFLGMGEFIDFTSDSQRRLTQPLRESQHRILDDMIKEKLYQFTQMIAFTKGRWIGVIEGDHYWQYLDGRTSDQDVAQTVGCPFLGTSAHIRIRSGLHETADTLIYIHHGIGSSRTSGGHLHRVEDMLKWIEADIYLMGHTHAKVANPVDRQYITPRGTHYHRTKMIARTGGFLRGYKSQEPLSLDEPAFLSRGGFVEKMAYVPTAMGGLCIGVGHEPVDEGCWRPTIHYSV